MGKPSGNMMRSRMQSIAMRVRTQVRHCMTSATMAGVRAYARTHAVANSMSTIPTIPTIPTISTTAAPAPTSTSASACAMCEDRVS
jgi:hypothetical protein